MEEGEEGSRTQYRQTGGEEALCFQTYSGAYTTLYLYTRERAYDDMIDTRLGQGSN